jgi:hypothetical protein
VVSLAATQFLEVENHASNATVFGQGACLWLDFLSGKDSGNWGQGWVAVQEFEVSRQLLNAIDVTPTLDFNRDDRIVRVPREDIDGTNRGRVFPPNQAEALSVNLNLLGGKSL